MGRCRFIKSVSVFGFFSVFLKVGSVFGIGFSKYRDIGVGFRFFLYYMLTAEQSQQSSSQLLILDTQCFYFAYSITN